MLKKLKNKFVIINMALVGTVLLIVFSVVLINIYQSAKAEVEGALAMALSSAGTEKVKEFEIGKPIEGDKDKPMDERYMMRPLKDGFESKPFNYAAVVMRVEDVAGTREIIPIGRNNASMDDEVMETAVGLVLESEKSQGKLKEMDLFYAKSEDLYGMKVAFADAAYFDAEIKKTIMTSLILFLLGMAAVFVISVFLANVAVRPVKKAWEQQRRFVADASHELKTPLTVLLANNEIISGMSENPDELRWVESSREEMLHMKALVDDLLVLARADETSENHNGTVKSKESFQETCLSDIVTGTVLQMEPVVFEAGAVMKTAVAENIMMRCDSTQMRQLVHILLDNAVKYCGENGKINVEMKMETGEVVLAVSNTGDVIEDEELEHIFDRFYRSDKARSGEGHGLGLSIAKTIAENHGGKIEARSNASEGTVMEVTFCKMRV